MTDGNGGGGLPGGRLQAVLMAAFVIGLIAYIVLTLNGAWH